MNFEGLYGSARDWLEAEPKSGHAIIGIGPTMPLGTKAASAPDKRCLVLLPKDFQDLGKVVKAALQEAEFVPVEVPRPSMETIAQVDYVLADISRSNANLIFLLGMAKAFARPIIILGSNVNSLPIELAGTDLINYDNRPGWMEKLQSKIYAKLKTRPFSGGVARITATLKESGLFAVDWDRLEREDRDNLCLELLTQLGFRQLAWEPRIKEFDLVAELPKKDPDGFDFKETWYVSLGRNVPAEMLLSMAQEPDYLLRRLTRYSTGPGLGWDLQTPITILIILIQDSHQRKALEAQSLAHRLQQLRSPVRIRVWDRPYLSFLVQQFPHIGIKYFSEERKLQGGYRKSVEELYRENLALSAKLAGTVAELKDERNKRVRAERDAVWKDISFSAAHKMGNPIFAIETFLQPLGKRIREGRRIEANEIISSVQTSVEKAKAIVDQFKSLTRAQELKPSPEQLRGILDEACHVARQQNIMCEVRCLSSLEVLVDREKLSECFDELVSNALHWVNKSNGQITIRASLARHKEIPSELSGRAYARINFKDNGTGIPIADKEKIFDAFYTTWEHGTGLGLALVRRIIEGQGGAISEIGKPGGGANFRIFLPAIVATK